MKFRCRYNVEDRERSGKMNDLFHIKKKACIFDLDGTLADTVVSIAHSGNQTLAAFGYAALPEQNYNYYAGDGAKELTRRFLSAAREIKQSGRQEDTERILADAPHEWQRAERIPDTDAEFQAVFAEYRRIFARDCMYRVKPFDGIPELLSELRRRGIRTAVLSNKPHIQTIDVVEKIFGKNLFDWVQGQQDGIPKKPAPDGALRIAERFSVRPEECIYSGDTNTDMQTGNAAGMLTLGVLWGFRDEKELLDNHAAALLRKPEELLRYLGE